MLACGQRHLSAETKLQSTNIPRIATPLSPHPGTEVSFLLERRFRGWHPNTLGDASPTIKRRDPSVGAENTNIFFSHENVS